MILIKRRNEAVHPLRRLLIQALTLGAPAALASDRAHAEASSLIITGLRLLTGKVLSVSRNQPNC